MFDKETALVHSALNAMPDMLRIIDLSMNVIYTNQKFDDYFGLNNRANCHSVLSLSVPCTNCVLKRALLSGRTEQMNHRRNNKILLIIATPIYDENKELAGVVELIRDITDNHKEKNALRAQNMRLLQEANLAARMQRQLFLAQGEPDERVSMASRYLPASSVGGDMFGRLKQRDGRISFYIADVSSHGLAAAMVTLLLANAMRGAQVRSAVQLLYKAREAFLSMVSDDQLYVTMFVALLDPVTGSLSWANAGLNAIPLLYNGEKLEKLYAPALPVCNWEDDIIYREKRCIMQRGGRLLLYTDGLTDERSSTLTELQLEEYMASYAGEELLCKLEEHVLDDHEDDVCMLHLTRL